MAKKRCNHGRTWTEEEDEFLRTRWKRLSAEKIGKRIGRSRRSVCCRASILGLRKQRRLTAEEKRKLELLYGSMPADRLAEILGITKSCIIYYCHRHQLHAKSRMKVYVDDNGVKKVINKHGISVYWSQQMIDDLRRMWPTTRTAEVAEYLGVSHSTVGRKAKELGLVKAEDFIRSVTRENLKKMILVNKVHGNSGMIRKGEHKSPETEFKKKKTE